MRSDAELLEFFVAWFSALRDKELTCRQVIDYADAGRGQTCRDPAQRHFGYLMPDFLEGKNSAYRLGRVLSAARGRAVGGLMASATSLARTTRRWRVGPAAEARAKDATRAARKVELAERRKQTGRSLGGRILRPKPVRLPDPEPEPKVYQNVIEGRFVGDRAPEPGHLICAAIPGALLLRDVSGRYRIHVPIKIDLKRAQDTCEHLTSRHPGTTWSVARVRGVTLQFVPPPGAGEQFHTTEHRVKYFDSSRPEGERFAHERRRGGVWRWDVFKS